MTLIISWIAMDCKKDGPKPSSIYIASDSRISWPGLAHFDYGRKVFGFKNYPDILGYCGDVLFPSIVLNQIVDIGDMGLLFNQYSTCKEKFEAIKEKLIQIFLRYPREVAAITSDNLQIIHASRDAKQEFSCRVIEWERRTGKFSGSEAEFKDHSDKLFVLGSGKKEYLNKFEDYWKSSNQKTSRAVFHCFCDTLSKTTDPYVGGAPQLVGLYRKFNAQFFGIIKEKKRYLLGTEISNLKNLNEIQWRNERFEICDGNTMNIKPKAQRQPNPLKDI